MSKHPIVHIEFSALDLESTAKFYEDLFGWKVEHIPEMHYATFDPGEGPGGGFNPVTAEMPAGLIQVYVGTDDVEATLKKAEELGATVTMPKMEIPNTGWFAFFRDPNGNNVGVFKSIQM